MPALKGVGLLKGLGVTLKTMTRPAVTRQYPHVKPDLPARTRGVIALIEENCTVCMLCARECPDWCIYIDSHKEQVAPKEGGRARTRNILDRFAIDFALCMYCGICVEVCPFDALHWSPEFEYAEHQVEKLTHEMDTLRTWAYSVPAPDPLEEGAVEPKEIESARKAREAVAAKAAAAAEQAQAAAPAPAPAAAGRARSRRGSRPRGGCRSSLRPDGRGAGLGRRGGGRHDHGCRPPGRRGGRARDRPGHLRPAPGRRRTRPHRQGQGQGRLHAPGQGRGPRRPGRRGYRGRPGPRRPGRGRRPARHTGGCCRARRGTRLGRDSCGGHGGARDRAGGAVGGGDPRGGGAGAGRARPGGPVA